METDYTKVSEFKGQRIKDVFLVSHSSNSYIRFLLENGTAFEVQMDEVFDHEGNRCTTEDLNWRP